MKSVLELEELANKAIKAAMNQRWSEAIELNEEVLLEAPDNIEAMNRLARAYQELGEPVLAKERYEQVLSLDPYNPIAQKNVAKLAQGTHTQTANAIQELFLEEPGRTRIIQLAQPQHKYLANMPTGERLELEDRHGRLALKTPAGQIAGYLPDEMGTHLLNLLQLGNTYSAYLMANGEAPQVFMRETSQSVRAAKFISFSRQHVSTHHASLGKDLLGNEDSLRLEPGMSEEGLEDWETESSEEHVSDLNDDFNSVSLESLREEEEGSYGGRDEY